MDAPAIRTDKYLSIVEIQHNLKKVEYIIMATHAPENFRETPLHFTLFLNTAEQIPQDIQQAILEKFCADNSITNPQEVLSQLMPVGFAQTNQQETPMPMLLIKPQDRGSIPHITMHVIDFLADSDAFDEAKVKQLTGWSYVYEA